MFLNMDQLEKQLDKEDFQEIGSMAAFRVPETQFQKFIKPWFSLDDDDDGIMTRKAQHKREYDSMVNERQMQTIEGRVDTSNALDANTDDADIKPIYDEEPMAEVQMTDEINVFAIGQQHDEQPEFNNEGGVDQDAEQCHDKRPLLPQVTKNQKTNTSNQSLESENTWQQSHFLNEKSNEAKVKNDIDVIETINIELEHKVAKLLKENETLKKHYKELYDSIKSTRAKTIEQTTSLIAQNAEFKAQPQKKGWKPTGRIFKTVGLRWVPTRNIFTSSTTKVDSEPPNGLNEDITNQYECEQTFDVSADQASLLNVKEVPTTDLTITTSITELQSQWGKIKLFRRLPLLTLLMHLINVNNNLIQLHILQL
ncbi:hypothetical protein Tco_1293102 [Tanacetum coccineum]